MNTSHHTNHIVNNIIVKQITGEPIDATEEATLNEWLRDPGNRTFYDDLTDPEKLRQQFSIMREFDPADSHAQLWQKIRARRRMMYARRIALIAASVILIVSMSTYWLFFTNRNKIPVAKKTTTSTPAVADVAPGKNTAVLTLSDGRKIALDSARGLLAEQGSTTVLNKDGQLVYQGQQPPKNGTTLYNILSTSNGQTYEARLQDGSRVWLNAASSIRFPVAFTGTERNVAITGEAYFEVAKDARRPFKVSSNGMQVEVLGTRFNINSYSDESQIRTTLLEGSVKVTSSGSGKQAVLTRGQQAVIIPPSTGGGQGEVDGQLKVVYDIDVEEVLAWKDGKFIFNDVDLAAAMRQIGRWYDVKISYGYDPARKRIGVNGEISRYTNISKVLDIMKATGLLDFTIEGKNITVIAK